MKFSEKIIKIRKENGLSQEEFGKFLENYINDMVDNIQELDSIKSMQSKLLNSFTHIIHPVTCINA